MSRSEEGESKQISRHVLTNGGRAIIIATLEKYKKNKTLMLSDYEVLLKAIANIPAAISMSQKVVAKQDSFNVYRLEDF
ncbi:MAG: hypothetical protein KOO69_02450 [Victivallales bacterium]|nr:hypothetical protein [Victivallales bacterium]